jgi:hypothetical protein
MRKVENPEGAPVGPARFISRSSCQKGGAAGPLSSSSLVAGGSGNRAGSVAARSPGSEWVQLALPFPLSLTASGGDARQGAPRPGAAPAAAAKRRR